MSCIAGRFFTIWGTSEAPEEGESPLKLPLCIIHNSQDIENNLSTHEQMKDKEIVLNIYIFECEKYYSSIKKENPATSNKMDDLEGTC